MTFSGDTNHPKNGIHRSVLRPLRLGFVAIALFLGLFGFWASQAPLTTSIHTSGHLNAPQPNFDIQHPFGGDIAAVLVNEHDAVIAGQVLVRMDVANESAQRAEVQESLHLLEEERDALAWALGLDKKPNKTAMPAANRVSQQAERVHNMVSILNVRRAATEQTAAAMQRRAKGLESSLAAREEQRRSMQSRFDRFSKLVTNGALRASESDTLLEAMLELDASIHAEQAEVAALRVQAAQVSLQVKTEELDLRQRLLDRQGQVAEAIPRLRMQALRLDAVLRNAELRAPSDGTIARLHFDTDQMFVPRGETVLTLTRPTEDHRVSFVVPPHAIDQTRVGMEGLLTVASLSQRNHPKVRVKIASLSPEARRNSDGVVIGYDGVARIDPADMALLRAGMGDALSLSIDMPVTLVFSGRSTTFADYLIGPFMEFLAKAMQD